MDGVYVHVLAGRRFKGHLQIGSCSHPSRLVANLRRHDQAPHSAMLHLAYTLVIIWTVSEVFLGWWKRSKDRSADANSLRLLWGSAIVFMSAGFTTVHMVRAGRFPLADWAVVLVVGLFAAGIALRWYAIVSLGRFFTVNVAIRDDHHIVTAGPYGIIRHPSYTGLLMMMLAIAISFGNWISALVAFVPFTAALLWRIRIEEAALVRNFGAQYDAYSAKTKRLIPWIY